MPTLFFWRSRPRPRQRETGAGIDKIDRYPRFSSRVKTDSIFYRIFREIIARSLALPLEIVRQEAEKFRESP